MNYELENNTPRNKSITKEAGIYDGLAVNDLINGIKMANYLNNRVKIREEEQRYNEANPADEELTVPTGTEIKQAREEGEYR